MKLIWFLWQYAQLGLILVGLTKCQIVEKSELGLGAQLKDEGWDDEGDPDEDAGEGDRRGRPDDDDDEEDNEDYEDNTQFEEELGNIQQLQQYQSLDENQKKLFSTFLVKYLRSYSKQQQEYRMKIFKQNLQIIKQHNQNRGRSKSRYIMGLNKFGDLTDQQYQNLYMMVGDNRMFEDQKLVAPIGTLKRSQRRAKDKLFGRTKRINEKYPETVNDFSPTKDTEDQPQQQEEEQQEQEARSKVVRSIDWRDYITFGPIKDQLSCAACYAFSVIGAVELNWAIQKEEDPPILSQQQMIDCCQKSGFKCNGCVSGYIGSSMRFLAKKGIALIDDYPYASKQQQCSQDYQTYSYLDQKTPFHQIGGLQGTKYFLLNNGPLSVSVDSRKWKFYKKGVFDQCPQKDKIKYSHSCVLIGIEEDGTWIIRNSWGDQWGQDGYMRLEGGESCGITTYVFLPLIQ